MIRPISKKRQKVNRERRKLQEAAWGPRPWRCWVGSLPSRAMLAGPCFGEVWGHEILKRSRSGSDENLLNVQDQVPLCNHHNEWVEGHPVEANKLGLADHSKK